MRKIVKMRMITVRMITGENEDKWKDEDNW